MDALWHSLIIVSHSSKKLTFLFASGHHFSRSVSSADGSYLEQITISFQKPLYATTSNLTNKNIKNKTKQKAKRNKKIKTTITAAKTNRPDLFF